MKRRDFITNTAKAGMVMAMTTTATKSLASSKIESAARNVEADSKKFKMKFAPNIYNWTGLFPVSYKGMSISEKIDFLGALGFTAFEDNDFLGRPESERAEIVESLKRNNMEMGVFTVALGFSNVMTLNRVGSDRKSDAKKALEFSAKKFEEAANVAKQIGAKWVTVVPGLSHYAFYDGDIFSNVLMHLRSGLKYFEPKGITMVLEPLNHINHAGLWLKNTAQATALCKATGSQNCKILFDVYHQQTEEGNLFRNIEEHFEEIAYFHLGDVPHRTEPLSGEINYKNLIKHIAGLGYKGILGMEHSLSQRSLEGERKLMRAYREIDIA